MQQYSSKVMEHFTNPRNVGEIENPDGVGHVGNPVCVVPDTLIRVNPGAKRIKEIKKNERVLGHDGRFREVKRVILRNYRGEIRRIAVQNLGEVTITPEHEIYALKMSHLDRRYSRYKEFRPDWHHAGELQKGDVILYPIPLETNDVGQIDFDIEVPDMDFKSREMPDKVELSDEFLKLAGYFLSEGYTRTDKSKGTVGFVFGAHEKEFYNEVIEYMKEIFGLEAAPFKARNNSVNLAFYSTRLARFFEKHFGSRAENKRLPSFMLFLSPGRQKNIIETLWKGGGYFRKKRASFVTISPVLAEQVKILLMRQRIIFSTLSEPRKGIHKKCYRIYIRSVESLKKLSSIIGEKYDFPQKKKNSLKAWYDDKYFYTRIKSVQNEDYTGKVYNLTVENSRSYTTDAACLHNCGDIMELYIKVDENEVITDTKFKTFGCGAAIATSSMVTELIKGKRVEEAEKVSNKAVAEALGGLPKVKMHCSVLAEEALQKAIEDYRKKKENVENNKKNKS